MKPAQHPAALHLIALAAALSLVACKGEEKAPVAAGTAGGQILEGSTSDAMLPLDTVRSQPPLAPKPGESGKAGAGRDATARNDSGKAESSGEASRARADEAATPNAE